jgi:hypothetical protein
MAPAANWPIGILASAFDFERGGRGNVTMAICTAYFHHDRATGDGVVRVVALVAPKARWRLFEERWPRSLRNVGLEALDIRDPALDLNPRALDALAHVVDQHVTRGFSCELAVEAGMRAEAGSAAAAADPEAFCAARVVARLQQWMAERHPDDLLLCVFEEGRLGQQQIRQALEAQGVTRGEPVQIWPRAWTDERGRTRRLRPLEACDLLAPTANRTLIDRLARRFAWEQVPAAVEAATAAGRR